MIGDLTKNKTQLMVQELLDLHWEGIIRAYAHQEDAKLQVSVSISLTEVKDKTCVDVGITFVAERIREHTQAFVDEKQKPLFESKK